jgi:hypothetical protein
MLDRATSGSHCRHRSRHTSTVFFTARTMPRRWRWGATCPAPEVSLGRGRTQSSDRPQVWPQVDPSLASCRPTSRLPVVADERSAAAARSKPTAAPPRRLVAKSRAAWLGFTRHSRRKLVAAELFGNQVCQSSFILCDQPGAGQPELLRSAAARGPLHTAAWLALDVDTLQGRAYLSRAAS